MKWSATSSDHPRACGANSFIRRFIVSLVGSSPRVRGKQHQIQSDDSLPRIIPARAGQTRARPVCTRSRTDHPRACGANTVSAFDYPREDGSSPRVRGKLARSAQVGHGVRIIPARAGQTVRPVCAMPSSPDHPRACGANGHARDHPQRDLGSSPRVRGKRTHATHQRVPARIIPARAGQTARLRPKRSARPDHPRACGANSGVFTLSADISGSSPRVRGKLRLAFG